jgi:hypothetical protein
MCACPANLPDAFGSACLPACTGVRVHAAPDGAWCGAERPCGVAGGACVAGQSGVWLGKRARRPAPTSPAPLAPPPPPAHAPQASPTCITALRAWRPARLAGSTPHRPVRVPARPTCPTCSTALPAWRPAPSAARSTRRPRALARARPACPTCSTAPPAWRPARQAGFTPHPTARARARPTYPTCSTALPACPPAPSAARSTLHRTARVHPGERPRRVQQCLRGGLPQRHAAKCDLRALLLRRCGHARASGQRHLRREVFVARRRRPKCDHGSVPVPSGGPPGTQRFLHGPVPRQPHPRLHGALH